MICSYRVQAAALNALQFVWLSALSFTGGVPSAKWVTFPMAFKMIFFAFLAGEYSCALLHPTVDGEKRRYQ